MTKTLARTRTPNRPRARTHTSPSRQIRPQSGAKAERYPHDYLHADRPYAETQDDVGGGLFLGAITLIALMTLIVLGLV